MFSCVNNIEMSLYMRSMLVLSKLRFYLGRDQKIVTQIVSLYKKCKTALKHIHIHTKK